MVASAAPVTRLVAPGPIEVVQAHSWQPVAHPRVAGRDVHHGLLVAALVDRAGRRARSARPGAGPAPCPARLPCPKMPKQPANSRCSAPSRSVRWAARNRTIAWATVSRIGRLGHDRPPRIGSRGSTALARPGRPDPGVGRVVADQPGPLGAGPGHDVQVVQVVARRRHRRAVPAVRDQHDVTRAHLGQQVERAGPRSRTPGGSRGRGRRARRRSRSSRSPRARDSPGRSVSCLCGGYDDQFPAGVSTSQAISWSVSKAAGVQKLLTCREQAPAPRSSTGTSAAGP